MKQINWFDRSFDFGAEQNIFPAILERLEGTPLRLAHKIKGVNPEQAILKPEGKWSIAEQIGHLSDLEPLWQGRVHDILGGHETMRPADLTNRKTEEANHNSKSLAQLLDEFSGLRAQTLAMLAELKDEDVFRFSLHPRLRTPMRMQDLFIFVADHDDHHLARITEIIKKGLF